MEVSSNGSVGNDKKSQPKTVRMVKRDSKDRLRDGHVMERGGSAAAPTNGRSWNEETTTSAISSPPPTLPRGNSQNVHNFLKNDAYVDDAHAHNDVMEAEKFEKSSQLSKASTLPRSFRAVEDLKDLRNHGNGPVYSGLVKPSMIHGGTKYNIGYRKKVCQFVLHFI